MYRDKYFEEYELGAEQISYGRTITEADFVIHGGQIGDFYPHHMNEDWCKDREFKRRIAHGTLVFSIGIGLSVIEINPLILYSIGFEHIRFRKPVFIGDTLYARVLLKDKKVNPLREKTGVITEYVELINQDKEIVMTCEHVMVVNSR
ncbi:dehydratase [Paenibacillus pinisoli]|uniref:Dehydratase n=1 Tax=Paenibacillus pinisoli TaxID=1276110 RepID=A0A3A6PH87_9BACL|nr:MaoC/PaaZ C-terminal domain-containing protein [Paenibacillus pinisoli]RJX37519.1 dehydratase [Paenibacillus pinisoli]